MADLRDKIIPAVAMMITIGAFAAKYDSSNNELYRKRTDAPKKPTIEAILNKEESFILPKSKNSYGQKKNFYYRRGIESKMYV